MNKIESIEQFESVVQENSRFFFIKHSATCPVSATAFQQFQSFINESKEEGYFLIVQESRTLSNHIAEKYAIKHESPQAFLFQDGIPAWHDSHFKITKEQLQSL